MNHVMFNTGFTGISHCGCNHCISLLSCNVHPTLVAIIALSWPREPICAIWDLDWFVSFCLVRISTWITNPWRQLSCSCLTQLDSRILELMELKGLLSWTELSLCVGVDLMLIAFWCHSSLNICLCGCLCCLSSASASVSLFEFLVNLSSAVSVSKSFSKFPRFVLDRNCISDSGNFGLWKYAVFPCF
jgi:hypothetical protein